jgi:predicted chitinase
LAALIDHVAGRYVGDLGLTLARAMLVEFPRRQIISPLRVAHFLAQAAHETGGFGFMVEIGAEAYFRRYDGRKDLGNTEPGDGARFKGRGIFQLTGRANYRSFGRRLGLDLEASPSAAAHPPIAVALAGLYWADRGLNAHADADDAEAVTRRINGGLNGLPDRLARLARAKSVLGLKEPA